MSVSGISTATQVAAGYQHACARLSNSTVKCWGWNLDGQLGNGNQATQLTPVSVSGISNATQIATGRYHSCALLADNTLKCWGGNISGQLGDGTTAGRLTPVAVSGITNATHLEVGSGHSCARLADSTLKCWGDNTYGQLGDGTTTGRLTPVSVSGISTATQVATHYEHTCAPLVDGTAKCWGYNAYRQLGDGTQINRSTPVTVSALAGATQLATGKFHTCARLSNDTAKCWGFNGNGQIGDGTQFNRSQPTAVSGLTGTAEVTADGSVSCARLFNGSAKCWGTAFSGELGNGVVSGSSLVPTDVALGSGPAPATPLEQSFGTCGRGVHAYSRTACRGIGVNTRTGAFTTQVTDLALPGIGVPFTLTRTYTSADAGDRAGLSAGWTHNLATALSDQPVLPLTKGEAPAVTLADDDILLYGDEGQQVLYALEGTNYVGSPGSLSTLAFSGNFEVLTHDQIAYRYDNQGRVTSVKDRNSQGLTFAYGADGLATVTDSVGRVITVQHVGGKISRVTLPDGRYVEYGYTVGRLTSVRDVRGFTTQYVYDAGGRLETIIDQNGHDAVHNVYDQVTGRVVYQDDATQNRSTFLWDEPTQTSTHVDPRTNQWKDVYSGNQVEQRINPLGQSTRFEYDGDLNISEITDPRGNTVAMEYDGDANLLRRTEPVPFPCDQEWTYNARNDPETWKDARCNVTDYEYDGAGNLTWADGPDADGAGPLGRPRTTYERDPAGTGLLKSLTDPRGKQTQYAYTGGNLTEIRTHMGHRTTLCYDAKAHLVGVVDPRGTQSCALPNDHRWTYTYNELGQLLTQTDPLGNVTETQYDPAGNVSLSKDALLRQTTYGYDDANRLASVTAPDPDGGGSQQASVTEYDYDAAGNLETRTDANDRVTTYGYDAASRLTSVTAPLGRIWTYDYDANGNLDEVIDANGNATPASGDGMTIYGYDELNRLDIVNYSDATPDVDVDYDANGNRTQLIDGSGTETSTYDPLNRLTSVTRGSNAFSYGYDLANLTQVTYPGGTSTTYAHNDDERLLSSTSGGLATTYTYDAAGNLQTTTHPSASGLVETRSYDRAGRLVDLETKRGSTTRARFVITPDPVGKPSQIVRTGALAQTQTYQYDAMDRLTGVCFQAGTCPGGSDPFIRWMYDGVGNRLSEARPGAATTTYTYNAADELTQAGSTAYTYDKNGNQLSAGSRTFTYDLADRMRTTTSGATTTTYSYDGAGKRLQASTGTSSSSKTNFLWDVNRGLPQIAQERNGSNSLQRQYIYGHSRIRQTQGTQSYYLYDGLGSVVNLTSSSGAVQRTYSYEPFGAVRTQSGSSPTSFLQFAGEYADPTGFYHLRARQYDPQTGRFLSRDPLDSGHPYAYASNAPTVFIDPSGLLSIGDIGHAALDIVGVIPVLGEPADAANCLWYGAEGNYTDAALSCGAMVPVLGTGFVVAKWGRRAARLDDAATTERRVVGEIGPAGNPGALASHDHHIFPQQFRGFFQRAGVNVDEYTVQLGQRRHLAGVHGRGADGLPGGYNSRWREFIADNPNPTAKEIFQFGGRLMDDYGLSGQPIRPYGRHP